MTIGLQENILNVLREAGITDAEVTVSPDAFEGIMVRIVTPSFHGMDDVKRRSLVAPALAGRSITWRQFLTEDEVATEPPMPSLSDTILPLWPESLARGSLRAEREGLVTFISDADSELESPVTVTFYSLRGGVGRSTSLANTARLLASSGWKVVCLDMDLEAPGLAALFNVEHEVQEGMGIVELLIQLDQGITPDFSKHLVPLDESEKLFLVPAGIPNAAYARDLSLLDPSAWYTENENPLQALLQGIRTKLPFTPDVILIDSRTGISPISAPLLFEQADLAIVVLFPHEQARRGTEALVKGLMGARNHRGLRCGESNCGPEIRFLFSPLPNSLKNSERLFHRGLEWVSEWLAPMQKARLDAGLLEINEGDITHWVPYREAMAASQNVLEIDDIEPLYTRLTDWIVGLFPLEPNDHVSETTALDKLDVLNEVKVDTGAAEDQESLLDVFIETDVVRRALSSTNPLILGRKGTGKTALFRRIKESGSDSINVMPVLSPIADEASLIRLSEALLRELDNNIVSVDLMQWKQVWMTYILLLACENGFIPETFIAESLWDTALPKNNVALVRWVAGLSAQPMFGLSLEAAFGQFDAILEKPLTLLWDGLDTQFGNEKADRQRRGSALVGLVSMVLEWERRFQNIKFKVLLREDIWREVKFENKSHLYGRAVILQWSDQNSFLQVLIKQLQRSRKFMEWLKTSLADFDRLSSPIERWSDEDILNVWHLIAGVRMSGGRTTFTRNWIWTRLADANNDHAPRHLLQLLRAAVEREKEQEVKSTYHRSLIRPNTLIKVLPEVSLKALDALVHEEFRELQPLIERLRQVARTPFDSSELDEIDKDLLMLAREVGLLGIHEGTDHRVERYRVPELYRLALNMTRRGQA